MNLTTAGQLLLLIILTAGCPNRESVDVTEIFWSAWTYPESFDSAAESLEIPSGAVECFNDLARRNLEDAESQLVNECRFLLQGSLLWNDCHEEVEGMEGRAQLYRDIANRLEGRVQFANSGTGLQLILVKALDPTTWVRAADLARQSSDALVC